MESKLIHTIKVVWTAVCRLLLGATFLFSGFVKAIDPFGFFYKLSDYLTAFGLTHLVPDSLLMLGGILLSGIEFAVGVFLLLGIRRIFASTLALLLMSVMTPLTLYLAIANPVSDCGCFGDAWVLTNWQTFGKNVVLLIAAISVWRRNKKLFKLITEQMEWVISTYTFLFVFVLSYYCYSNLPILDFRPYHIGADIKAGMQLPQEAGLDSISTTFVLSKNGEECEFTLDNYPDSTWTFVRRQEKVIRKGRQPMIHDFEMVTLDSDENIVDSVLSDRNYTFLLVANRIEEADEAAIDIINEVYDYSVEHGYAFYALTASGKDAIEEWRDKTGAEYPFCRTDDITLKTIIRSNPGMLLLKHGVILNKWSDANIPDEYHLTDYLDKLPLGELAEVNEVRTIGYVLLWYFIPLSLVLLIDLLWVRKLIKLRSEN